MGVSVRHNARLAAVVALLASVMTVAWFARALQSGSVLDWVVTVVVAAIGILQLLVVRDGRAPLMLADEHGVRVRRGETWSGLRWQDIEHVEVQSPASWWRDGQIVVHPRPDGVADVPEVESYAVPLAMTTRVEYDGLTGDLVADLDSLASGQVPVLVLTRLEPATPQAPEEPSAYAGTGDADLEQDQHDETGHDETEETRVPRPTRAERRAAREEARESAREERRAEALAAEQAAEQVDEPAETDDDAHDAHDAHDAAEATDARARWRFPRQGARVETAEEARVAPEAVHETPDAPHDSDDSDAPGDSGDSEDEVGPVEPAEPVEPSRRTRPAARVEITRESVRRLPVPPAIPAQRVEGSPVLVARVDDLGSHELSAPEHAVIGPLVAAARHRARLSIDTLSERTRIRPHVLERIEVDDFDACGGDFYARGHLRTLARIFGLDAEELVALFDEHYAHAEIEARQVFEAELASGIGGGVRAAHTGPRWSLLAACVLALASIWGVARFFNDTPQELVSPAPNVVDSAGLASQGQQQQSSLAPLEVHAVGASPQVVVRDRGGAILWAGKLADDQRQQVIGLAPFEVTASNGEAVKVAYLGKAAGAVGGTSAAASKSFGRD